MSKIIINGQSLNNNELFGIQRYTLQILNELDKVARQGRIELIIPPWEENHLDFQNIDIKLLRSIKRRKPSNFLWNHRYFPSYVKKSSGIGVDLTLSMPLPGCDIVAIHDCIPERFPQNYTSIKEQMRRVFYIYKAKVATRKSKVIVSVSENSKKDIVRYYKCNPEKIKIVPNGWQHFNAVQENDTIISRLNLTKNEYCFALGSRLAHKNHRWIIEAARQNPMYKFVVTGSNSLKNSETTPNNKKPDNLVFTGYLKDSEIKSLMKYCKVFIQPSFYEGFGIPPMEAMSTGTQCIVSNTSSLPEVYGHSVWHIDPYEYKDISIDRIMSEAIDDNSTVLEKYSWKSSARDLNEIFEKLARGETI